jgi:hypothetical protein
MVAYAMSTAMEKGYISANEFYDNAKKAYAGILSNIELNDAGLTNLYGTVRGTRVGDYDYYVNQPQLENDPHGIGAFLICNEQIRNQFPVLFKTFQAENASIHRGVEESTNRGFTGASYVNCHNEVGSYIEWEVHASQPGMFPLTIRYANGTDQNRFCDVDINGGESHIDDLDFNGTQAWTLWKAQTCQIYLNQGANTIRITADQTNGPPNIDWIGFDDYVFAPVEEYQAEEAFIYHGSIDSDHPGYTGDGFVNYDNEIGSYVVFDVQAQASGIYMLIFRYANGTNQNRFCDVDVNGELLINNVSFEGTGAWENWFTQTCRVFLHSGANTIYLTADQSNGGPNLDKMDVMFDTASYQAEDALIYHGSIDFDHPGYTGGGFVNYDNEIGSYVELNIHIPVHGTSTLIFRYANGTSQNRFCDVYLNGEMAVDDLSFPGTGAWQDWSTQSCLLTMNGGYNTIRLTADQSNGGPNLDRMEVLPANGDYLGW